MGDPLEEYRKMKAPSQSQIAQARKAQSVISGIGDFGANVVGDLGEIASGLGSVLTSAGHDVVQLAKDRPSFLGGDNDINPDDYSLFQMAKALPGALKEDYSRRYGSVEGFKEGLYEDPLSFLGDVGAVLTLGGSIAAKGAGVVGRSATVADDLARLAEGASDVGRTARVVDKILPGMKYGEGAPLGGSLQRVNQATGRIEDLHLAANPYRRAKTLLRQNRRTEPLAVIEQRIAELDDVLEHANDLTPMTEVKATRDLLGVALDSARKSGIDKALKPRASLRSARQLASRIVSESGASFIQTRNEIAQAHLHDLVGLPDDELPSLHRKLQGIDPHQSAGRLSVPQIRSALSDPGVLGSPLGDRIATVVRPHLDNLADLRQKAIAGEIDPLEADAAERFIEIVAGEPLAALGADAGDDIGRVIDNTRLTNLEHEASHLLETGGDYRTLFDRLYNPIRVKEMLEKGLDSLDEATDPFILDDARRAGNVKAPAYYPQYAALTGKRSDFLMKNRTWGMGSASNPKVFRENRGRLMGDYLKGVRDSYLTDPKEAYGRLAAEIAGHKETARLVDDLKNAFGYKIDARAEIPEGFVVINPESIKLALRKNVDLRTEATRELMQGSDPATSLATAAKKLFDETNVEKDLRQLLETRGEIYAVPQVVAERLQAATNWSLGSTEKYARLYADGPMNVWRASVLFLKPGYHLNNIVGNAVFRWLQGGSPLLALNRGYNKAAKKLVEELGVGRQVGTGFNSPLLQYTAHMGAAEDLSLGRAAARVKGTAPGRAGRWTVSKSQQLGSFFEDSARRESFISAAERDLAEHNVKLAGSKFIKSQQRLSQILKYGIDNPDAVKRWIDSMNDAMNNYANLNAFERKVVRRFLMPFWAFTRHAGKKLVTMPIEHPAKARFLQQMDAIATELDSDFELPDWLTGALPIGPGAQPGDTRFLSGRAMNPLNLAGENPINAIHPYLKFGIESATGRELLTGNQFTAPDVVTPFGSEQQYQIDPETGEPVPTTVRPGLDRPGLALEMLLNQFPQYRLARDLTSGGARYDTGETITDPATGQPKYPVDPLQSILKYLGASTADVNLEELRRRQEAERAAARNALDQLLP